MKDELLEIITSFYLGSHDFNGIPVRTLMDAAGGEVLLHLKDLILERKISIVFGDVHPNPHIRALPDDHAPEQQVENAR
jgi:hypothetical protein